MKPGIPWLSDSDYLKAKGQLRLQLNGIMSTFRMHGMDAFVPGAIEQIILLAEQFGMRVRGIDEPIDIMIAQRKKKEK